MTTTKPLTFYSKTNIINKLITYEDIKDINRINATYLKYKNMDIVITCPATLIASV